jgi:VanZ family protein
VSRAFRDLVSLVDPWLPPLALMAAIYFFSSQPDLSSGLGVIDLIGRKLIHAAEYAFLCFLWWRALRRRLSTGAALIAALAVTVGYAALDEYHQSFVEGRNGSPVDVAIDAVGAAAAAALVWRGRATRRPRASRAPSP